MTKNLNRSIVIGLLMTVFVPLCAKAWDLPKETLTYDIMYKWGLINKKAGVVALTTIPRVSDSTFSARLTGATAPWADKIFMVRDTLKGTINQGSFMPVYYEKVSHEGNNFSHDILNYERSGDKVTANSTVRRLDKKSNKIVLTKLVHEAEGPTLDMLSSYYYMRQLDYPSMKPGDLVKLNIFSGKRKEILTIHYRGVKKVDVGNKSQMSYHITFTFTTEGGKTSSDSMEAWIGANASRIPLLMEGKLPVGKVRAVYAGSLE